MYISINNVESLGHDNLICVRFVFTAVIAVIDLC